MALSRCTREYGAQSCQQTSGRDAASSSSGHVDCTRAQCNSALMHRATCTCVEMSLQWGTRYLRYMELPRRSQSGIQI